MEKTKIKESDIEKTVVVNVKVSNIRPKYKNLKEWIEDKKNVYIGRKGVVFIDFEGKKERFPKSDSVWANPFKISEKQSRRDVIELYEKYIRTKIENEKLKEELILLQGKNLGCWCYPEECHGDVLIKLIKEYF